MSQSMWGYWLIAMGIGVLTVMMLVQNYTTINQEDYYLLKEVTQAAMNDAIDYNHYRQYGELKINREKFIENFERRFAESVKGNKNYQTDFYEIYETPPKVSVKVSTKTSSFNVSGDTMDLDVTNSIDAILENNSTNTITDIFYSVPYGACYDVDKDYLGYCKVENSPMLSESGITNYLVNKLEENGYSGINPNSLSIISAKYIGPMETDEEYQNYKKQFERTYGAWEDYEHAEDNSKTYEYLKANEIKGVKLTVANNRLFWSGKFKCYDEDPSDGISRGFSEGTYDYLGYHIKGQCMVGIKYELKFSY